MAVARTVLLSRIAGRFGLVLLVGGCTTSDGRLPPSRAATGVGVGAIVGGVAGAIIDSNDVRGPLIGAAVGAALGGGIGYALDRQQAELEQALERERAARAATVQRVAGDRLLITINDEVAFDPESVAIRPTFLPTLERVADVLSRSSDAHVLVVGHTDAMGSAAYNRRLSAERAEAVRQALATYGVDASRVRAEGRGEAEPRGDNGTAAGRQANRRVEIMVTPA
jgi:outer membrane protein OmpA-like peptidoglycan-associated protein